MNAHKSLQLTAKLALIALFLMACSGTAAIPASPTALPPTITALLPTDTATAIPPTDTPMPPTETPLPPTPIELTPTTTLGAQPEISAADRQTNQLIPMCERIYIVKDKQVLVPYYLDCYHQLFVSSMGGNVLGVISPDGQLGSINNGMLAAVFMEIRFVSYPLNGNTIQADQGNSGGSGEVWISYAPPDKWVAIVKLGTAGDWSGYVDPAKAAFDLKKPINQQTAPPLQEGNPYQ